MTPFAQRELNELVERMLKEAGLTKPPVRLEDLLAHLKLYREYYDLSDPGFLDRRKGR